MSYSVAAIDYTTLPEEMLSLAKQHMRVDFNDDDEVITRYLAHAIRLLENFWGRSIFAAEVTWRPKAVTGGACARSPVQPVSSFTAKDSKGATVTDEYELRNGADATMPVFLCRKDGAALPSGLEVMLAAGYDTIETMDPAVESAVLRVAGTFYEHRESMTTLSAEQMPFWLNDLLGGLWIPRC